MDRRLGALQQRLQSLFSFDIGKGGEVLARQFDQVEGMKGQSVALPLRSLPALEHLLKRREIRIAVGVDSHDFSVDEAGRQVQRSNRFNQRTELVGPILPVARIDCHVFAFRGDKRAIAVEFYLVHPAIARRHVIDERGELGLAVFGTRSAACGTGPGFRRTRARRFFHLHEKRPLVLSRRAMFAILDGGDLGHRSAGRYARQLSLDQRVAIACVFVLQFAQQPVLAFLTGLRLQSDKQPFPHHTLALEHEMEMAILQIAGALALDRRPCAPVPQHDRAAAIFLLGNDAFEFGIGQGMVFGAHRKAFDIGIGRGALGHRPAFQHPVHFQPEVPVKPGGVVLLDYEQIAAGTVLLLARRFGRLRKIALGVVDGEGVLARRHRVRPTSCAWQPFSAFPRQPIS